jgi:hypothetical protein
VQRKKKMMMKTLNQRYIRVRVRAKVRGMVRVIVGVRVRVSI